MPGASALRGEACFGKGSPDLTQAASLMLQVERHGNGLLFTVEWNKLPAQCAKPERRRPERESPTLGLQGATTLEAEFDEGTESEAGKHRARLWGWTTLTPSETG